MKTIAQRISKIASRAQTEEDLKIGVETVIREYLVEQSDIEIIPEYEKITGIRGRRDAVYGHFTIEYKKPGELENQNRLKRAAIQLAGYLEDVAKIDNGKGEEALKRVAGACIDGKKIFFLRYWPSNIGRSRSSSLIETYSEGIHGGFQLMGPYPVTPESIDELFRYMRALHRRPLSPEYLAGEFGPGTETAQFIVGALYQSFANKESETVKTLFKQWEYTFGIVYGAETVKARSDIPELAKGYGLPKEVSLKHSLFAVHTYFALIMKLIAAEVVSLQQGSLAPSLIGQLSGMAPAELENQMNQLEDGGIFKAYGIKNFLEGDFFRWYLSVWDGELAKAIRLLASKLSGFEPTTPFLRPGEARDLLKKLYQYLVPKKLRHDLGEYYTPDWIAERLLNQLSYHGNPNTRILDPACGSGTFLTLAIDRVRRYMQDHFWDRDPSKRKECAAKILRNIVGFDLNPLAVIAARTNFLLVFGDLIRDIRPIEIPVYMCDSILTPVLQKKAQQRQMSILDEKDQNYFYLPTSAGEFIMPKEVLDKKILEQITHAIEDCIRLKFTPEEFLTWVENEGVLEKKGSYELLKRLYAQIMDLEAKGKNGIWARLLKNSFAPVLQKSFDLVVGNPPWVNWESLSEEWRNLTKDLWVDYGLFSLKGHAARLGGGKKDLSMLFTYACSDYYLRPKGQLGFVITQTIFKSKHAGDGFRRLKLGEKGVHLRVKHVDDMTELQPFEGATNQTAILVLQKNFLTRYPVVYTLWRKKPGPRISLEASLKEAWEQASVKNLFAIPIDRSNLTSPWITARGQALRALQAVIDKSDYKAWVGACTWLNGAFWVRILDERPDGLVIVENLHNIGKIKLPKVRSAIEPNLIYPLIRGRDIKRWKAAPSTYILLTQNPTTRKGWPESEMKTKWPCTYSFLKQFEHELRNRSGYKKYFDPKSDAFWSIYNVGSYTLAPYKVMWRQMLKTINAAVIETIVDDHLGAKTPITQHVVSFVPFENREEAHYFSSFMNSTIVSLVSIACFTGKGFGTPGLMDFIKIPKYQPENSHHKRLACLSIDAHRIKQKNNKNRLEKVQNCIDLTIAEILGYGTKELSDIQRSLEELS